MLDDDEEATGLYVVPFFLVLGSKSLLLLLLKWKDFYVERRGDWH